MRGCYFVDGLCRCCSGFIILCEFVCRGIGGAWVGWNVCLQSSGVMEGTSVGLFWSETLADGSADFDQTSKTLGEPRSLARCRFRVRHTRAGL